MARITPVVLAGGAGARLWPLSRMAMPKPFVVTDGGGFSLFHTTLMRVADRRRFAPPLIVCNEAHRFLVLDALHEAGCPDATLILEPEGRNTAAAICLAAMHVAAEDPDSILLVLPSDHRIDAPEVLATAINAARPMVEAGQLATFAVTPEGPQARYGYIVYGETLESNVYRIAQFVEKPEIEHARSLLAEGRCGWNSGIFLMRTTAVLGQLQMHAPRVFETCRAAYAAHRIDLGCIRPEALRFAACPSLPFDRAVMERTALGIVIPVAMGWHDLGSWAALDGVTEKDAMGNAVMGAVTLQDVENCYIRTHSVQVAAAGLRGLVVVEQDGQLLIAEKSQASNISPLGALSAKSQGAVTYRPWGHFCAMERGGNYQVKKLCIRPGSRISLQSHAKRAEHWVVVKGTATVTRGEDMFTLREN